MAKGKALLAEAGVPDGYEVELDAFNTSPYTEMAQSIQETMGQAGLKVSILSAEKKAVYTKHRGRAHKMIMSHWSPDYLDPHSNADAFSSNPDNSSDAPKSGILAWRAGWEIPELTKLTAAAKTETDGDKRKQMYHDLQKRVQDASPFIIMFQSAAQTVLRKNVKGFVSGPSFDLVFYRNITK